FSIAVIGERREILCRAVVPCLDRNARLTAEQSSRVPVDDRANVVLIEQPRQTLEIDILGLFLPSRQVLIRVCSKQFAARVEVPVSAPHSHGLSVLFVFVVYINHAVPFHLSSLPKWAGHLAELGRVV